MKAIAENSFAYLQKIGKALMLPVAVLPAAGILMALGAANFTWMSTFFSQLLSTAGNAIFLNLPLLFAVSVSISFTNNDGVAALSTCVAFLVMLSTMGRFALWFNIDTVNLLGFKTIDTGVLGGIIIGCVVAFLFNRFHKIKLPDFLDFFSGKRFIPIISSLAAIIIALVLTFLWPPLGIAIKQFSQWATHENSLLAFSIYGAIERLLIPFGLHHLWNVPFFFEVGSFKDPITEQIVHGEIARYLSGDPSSGNMAGGYLFKMFGLPAAAFAIWHSAKPEKKKLVGGIMLSAALTAFFTGITEPIEFAFLFAAPLLYFMHCIFSGLAYTLCIFMGIKHGTTFSHGLIDYFLLLPQSSNAVLIPLLGIGFAILYYTFFRFTINLFRLPTLGRENETGDNINALTIQNTKQQLHINIDNVVKALGGVANIDSVDACITRLRVEVMKPEKVDSELIENLGAAGVFKLGRGVQLVFGSQSESIKEALLMQSNSVSMQKPNSSESISNEIAQEPDVTYLKILKEAFGGSDNITKLERIAHSRIRIELKKRMEPEHTLKDIGVEKYIHVDELVIHCILIPKFWRAEIN